MHSRIASLVLSASLAFAAPASAATPFTFVNAGTVTAYGYFVGPYNGLMGTESVFLNCVDFFHRIEEGQVWDANLTALSEEDGFGTVTRFNNVATYRMAAYLTTLFADKTPEEVGEIQATIWSLFGPDTPGPGTNAWRNLASDYVTANPDGSNYAGFYVVSSVNNRLPNGADNPDSEQEFLVVVPEPATLLLLASGMAGLAGLRLRRKKNS